MQTGASVASSSTAATLTPRGASLRIAGIARSLRGSPSGQMTLCLPCRRCRYALACVGGSKILSRYQEWARPYLACLRLNVSFLNERVAVLMTRAGRYIKAFLDSFDVVQLRAVESGYQTFLAGKIGNIARKR